MPAPRLTALASPVGPLNGHLKPAPHGVQWPRRSGKPGRGRGREADWRAGWKGPITHEGPGMCPRQTGGEVTSMPSSRPRCPGSPGPGPAPGAAARGKGPEHREAEAGLKCALSTLGLRRLPAAAPCQPAPGIPGPRPCARAHILGAAGRVGRGAIWKFPGLGEHLCNWFGGGLDGGLARSQGQTVGPGDAGAAPAVRARQPEPSLAPQPLNPPEGPVLSRTEAQKAT